MRYGWSLAREVGFQKHPEMARTGTQTMRLRHSRLTLPQKGLRHALDNGLP